MLRQSHLPPFASAIEQGALSVMINSGAVNGVPSHADRYLITEILKGELQFEGFTISDWEDVRNLHSVHQVAVDEKDAVRISVNAGLDMCMDPYDATFATYLIEHVTNGNVSMERVDDAVRRILRVKFKLGLFEQTMSDPSLFSKYGSAEHSEAALQAALESLTLLKNDQNILPLPKGKKVLVAGVAAHSLTAINGAWSRTWNGQDSSFNDVGKQTILDAIRTENGKENVVYAQGSNYDSITNLDAALKAAEGVDYIVLCLGEKPATEKPSDIDDLRMSEAQREMAKSLAATGKPIIFVITEARPRIINDIEPLADGIIMAYLPGNEGGSAIAQVLFGRYNPSGKLPLTYPRHPASLWAYDHTRADARDAKFGFEGFNPQWEFGHGMSYTDFAYSDLQLSKDTLSGDEKMQVNVTITNTGSRSGKEVVQVYSSDLVASLVPAVRQLRRFQKIELAAGTSQKLNFTLSASDLAFVNLANEWTTEPGAFELHVGNLNKRFYYQKELQKASSIKSNNRRKRKQ
jgi:beta-glucosidase